jgi:hypothetical protein
MKAKTEHRKGETEREVFITPPIVTIKGPHNQAAVENSAKFEHDG